MLSIATRGSKLALWQANEVARLLAIPHEIKIIKTTGDILANEPLKEIGGKEVFTRELDNALLNNEADIAVHSLKDVPGNMPDKLEIIACLKRADARDVLIGANSLAEIPTNAIFGTSSPRRMAQVRALRPDLKFIEFRGNVETRIEKLKNNIASATLLANAGISRLRLNITLPHAFLPLAEFTPAIGQGIICVVAKRGAYSFPQINHQPSFTAAIAEREVLKTFGGNCYTPLSAHAEINGNIINISGFVAKEDGTAHHSAKISGEIGKAASLGCELGKELLYWFKTNS